ncbi:unnamed protein product [Owenia fusiformis]|uniref:Tantalus-like domain-containing protein n=1 Tax=Owenia fusiformis TaxID=6347 RepID=A0A8S4Q727_OWEFU|nr:unnamed protein product [Owenia fusiformis]
MTMTSKNLEPKESPSWGIPLLQRIISKTSDTSKDDHHTFDAQNVNDAKYTEKQPLTTNTTCATDGANLVGIYDETESHHGTTEETPKSSQHAKADGTDLQSINDQASYHFDPKDHLEDNCSKNDTPKKPSKSSDKFVKIKSKRTITRPRKLKDKECEIISKTETSLAKHIIAKTTDSQFKPVVMTTLSAMSHQVENLETVQTGNQEASPKANTETIVNLETVNNLQDQAESTELHQILPKESVAIETVSIETKTRQQEKAVNFDDFEIQFEDDPPPKTDFISSKPRRGRPPKYDRRKSRQSMDFTASISLTSTLSEPTETSTTRVPKSSSTDIISSDSGISEIALNDLHLPFDEDDQPQCSPKPIQRPKRKRQGRKSADFDIINTSAIILSPELDPGMISENPDIVPPLGASRRSKRIRRKSLEIFRQSQHEKEQKLQLIETLNSTSAAVTKSIPTNVQPQNSPSSYPHPEGTTLHPQDTTLHPEDTTLHPQETTLHPTTTKHEDTKTYNKCNAELKNKSPNYVSNMIHNVTLVEEHLHETVHGVDTTVFDIPAVIEPPVLNTCESVGAKNRIIKQSFSRKYSPEKCKEGEPESLGRGKRAKKTLVNYAELDQCDEEDSKSRSPKKKRKKEDVSIEDIYKNKNYVAPAEKPWETIYETPHHNDVMTKKKFKRTMIFEDYSIGRLKKRRQKAMKNGWKPPRMGKKKTELLEKTLDKKLASLEEEIENNFPNSPQPSTSSTGSSFVPYNNNGPLAIAEQPRASSSPANQQTEQNSVPTISESEIPKDSKNSLKQQKSSKRKCPPKRKSSKKQSELEKVESHNENETHENTVIPDNIVIPDTIETSDMVETNEKVDIKDEVKTQDKVESQIKIDKTKDNTGSTQDLNIDVKAISSETKSEVKVFEGEVHVDVKKEPSLLTESSNNTNKVGVIIEPPDHVDVKVENISMDEITDNGAIPEDLNAEDKKIGDVKSVVDMEPNKEMEVDLFFTPMKDIPVPSQKGNEMSNSNDDGDISGLDTIAEESVKETMETSQTKALSETYHVSKEPVSGSKNVCDESKESFSESKADDYLTPQTTLSDTDTNSSLLNATANESLLEGVLDSSDEAVQSLNSSLDSLDPIQLLEKSRNSRIAEDTRDLLTPVSEEDLNTGFVQEK